MLAHAQKGTKMMPGRVATLYEQNWKEYNNFNQNGRPDGSVD